MTATEVKILFVLHSEAQDQCDDIGIDTHPIGDDIGIEVPIDEELVDSMRADELIEFVGIDSEFLIYASELN